MAKNLLLTLLLFIGLSNFLLAAGESNAEIIRRRLIERLFVKSYQEAKTKEGEAVDNFIAQQEYLRRLEAQHLLWQGVRDRIEGGKIITKDGQRITFKRASLRIDAYYRKIEDVKNVIDKLSRANPLSKDASQHLDDLNKYRINFGEKPLTLIDVVVSGKGDIGSLVRRFKSVGGAWVKAGP